MNPEKIINGCKKGDRNAQRTLFNVYAPILKGICIRYAGSDQEAEDILQEGFIKILLRIDSFKGDGSFENWMKRIMVNTAISSYHKNKKYEQDVELTELVSLPSDDFRESDFTAEELLGVINDLPEGYKVIFNLYAIEGYKHREIAEKLNISVSTSKSQYARARESVKQKLNKLSEVKKSNG